MVSHTQIINSQQTTRPFPPLPYNLWSESKLLCSTLIYSSSTLLHRLRQLMHSCYNIVDHVVPKSAPMLEEWGVNLKQEDSQEQSLILAYPVMMALCVYNIVMSLYDMI